MMAQPVNLNRYRKQVARAEKQARADQNIAHSGRTKAERELDKSRTDKAKRDLDGHASDP